MNKSSKARYPHATDLTERVCLVTGASRGIGEATAHRLAEAGATVVVCSTILDGSRLVAEELTERHGTPADAMAFDLRDSRAMQQAIRDVARKHGQLDAVVANAGILEDAVLGMISDDVIDRVLQTNVAGTLRTVQAAARVMTRQRGGSMVLLASIVGERGNEGQVAYSASKSAVATIARSAAKELGRFGIRVNAVAPGVIQTDMISHLDDDVLRRRVDDTALGRLGTPDDVARVIRFLVSDDAGFVTGQVLGVDGGLVI